MDGSKKTPFEKIGGRPVIEKVTKAFYDRVYRHPWIGQYFANIPQEHIENQQTDFMQGAFRGKRIYSGRMPADAHMHMVINDELFDLRNRLLKEAMDEVGVAQEMQDLWLSIDEAFRKVLVKDAASARPRYRTDEILNFLPNGKAAS